MAIGTGQRIIVSPVTASGNRDVTIVGTAWGCSVIQVRGAAEIGGIVDMSSVGYRSMAIVTCVNDGTVHMLVMAEATVAGLSFYVRVVVTGGAIIGDGDTPVIVGDTVAIVWCALGRGDRDVHV